MRSCTDPCDLGGKCRWSAGLEESQPFALGGGVEMYRRGAPGVSIPSLMAGSPLGWQQKPPLLAHEAQMASGSSTPRYVYEIPDLKELIEGGWL